MKKTNQLQYPCDEKITIEIGFKCPLKLSDNPNFIDGKRFCEMCNKNVYDLRNLSNAEILKLSSGKETICGRIQANRISNQEIFKQNFARKILTSFAFVAFFGNIFGQKKKSDTLTRHEIEGFTVVAIKSDDSDNSYYTPKRNLIGSFTKNNTELKNTKIIKLNQSTINFGLLDYNGNIDFSIEEYLVEKQNILLIETPDPSLYYYQVVKKEQFNDRIYYNILETNIIKSEFPQKESKNDIYIIEGEEVDFDEFTENIQTNKDVIVFYLNHELASILLNEKLKKGLYIGYYK